MDRGRGGGGEEGAGWDCGSRDRGGHFGRYFGAVGRRFACWVCERMLGGMVSREWG